MQKYSDTILNKQGKPVAGAVVTVTTYPGNDPAAIYAVDGGQQVQSVTSDQNGRFAFYAADGHYNLSISGRGIDPVTITDIVLNDPNDDAQVAASVSQLLQRRVATPDMFGIPQVSADVDYTAQLQAMIDTRSFAFPEGFQVSCKTLYLRSNSVGDFKNAKFTLLPNQPAGTQLVVLGDATGYRCENSTFYGGVFDGNRANNTIGGNPGTISGGDGGQHGIQVHNARCVRWYGPKTINCNTDGILVWQKTASEPGGATLVSDVHFYSPVSDGNGRQGVSVCACDDMHFYDGVFSNNGIGPTGRLPKSGIDIEGNNALDNVSVRFHGRTLSAGNVGRGFMTHNPGGVYNITFDDLACRDNLATDTQVALYIAAGNGMNNFRARKVELAGSASYGMRATSFALTTEAPINNVAAEVIESDKLVTFSSISVLDIGRIKAFGASTTADTASVSFSGNCRGSVRDIEAYNTSASSNGYCALLTGAGSLTIGRLYCNGPRGAHIDGASNKTIRDLVLDGAMVASGVRLNAATKNALSVRVVGTIASDRGMRLDGASNENDISMTWTAAPFAPLYVEGSRNRLSVRSIRTVGDIGVSLIAGANENLIHSSHFKGQTNTGLVSDLGTSNVVLGSFPKAVNTP